MPSERASGSDAGAAGVRGVRRVRWDTGRRRDFCLKCGYSLAGLELPRNCPECGLLAAPFRRFAAEQGFLRRLRPLAHRRPAAVGRMIEGRARQRRFRRRLLLFVLGPLGVSWMAVLGLNALIFTTTYERRCTVSSHGTAHSDIDSVEYEGRLLGEPTELQDSNPRMFRGYPGWSESCIEYRPVRTAVRWSTPRPARALWQSLLAMQVFALGPPVLFGLAFAAAELGRGRVRPRAGYVHFLGRFAPGLGVALLCSALAAGALALSVGPAAFELQAAGVLIGGGICLAMLSWAAILFWRLSGALAGAQVDRTLQVFLVLLCCAIVISAGLMHAGASLLRARE